MESKSPKWARKDLERFEAIARMRKIRKLSALLVQVCEGRTAIEWPPSRAFLRELSGQIQTEVTFLSTLIGR